MTTPETTSRTGGGLPPAEELKTALTGFVSEFKTFSTGIHAKLQKQEERMNKLDRKSLMAGRPALSSAAETEAPHQKAFAAYLRSGDDDALRGLEVEGKSLVSSVAADGGYLVDPQTAETVKSTLSSTASLRAVANVVNVDASSYEVLIDQNDTGAGWSTETAATAETGTPKIEKITIPLHELSALPKASQRLLDDSAFDIEAWLAERIATKFAQSEAAAFVNGDGVDKPKGFLTHPIVEEELWEWGNIGYVPTGEAGDLKAIDPLLDLVYSLDAPYRANASFVMSSRTAGTIRKLKDSDGRPLWADSIAAGQPARLLGYPILIAEDMPDIGEDEYAIAFGDFGAGYTIAERPDLRVLRDPFSSKPNVLFYATKRVGGDVSDFGAIKLLKFSVA